MSEKDKLVSKRDELRLHLSYEPWDDGAIMEYVCVLEKLDKLDVHDEWDDQMLRHLYR
jgi:hypothetical protein